jgi:hypothetical protein
MLAYKNKEKKFFQEVGLTRWLKFFQGKIHIEDADGLKVLFEKESGGGVEVILIEGTGEVVQFVCFSLRFGKLSIIEDV